MVTIEIAKGVRIKKLAREPIDALRSAMHQIMQIYWPALVMLLRRGFEHDGKARNRDVAEDLRFLDLVTATGLTSEEIDHYEAKMVRAPTGLETKKLKDRKIAKFERIYCSSDNPRGRWGVTPYGIFVISKMLADNGVVLSMYGKVICRPGQEIPTAKEVIEMLRQLEKDGK